MCFVFVKYTSFSITHVFWTTTCEIINRDYFRTVGCRGQKCFYFYNFWFVHGLKFFFFFSGLSARLCPTSSEPPQAKWTPTLAKSIPSVFGKPVPSSAALPWILDPCPQQTLSRPLALLPSHPWTNTYGDPATLPLFPHLPAAPRNLVNGCPSTSAFQRPLQVVGNSTKVSLPRRAWGQQSFLGQSVPEP